MSRSLICPYNENCIIYKNFKEQTGDERINIIQETINGYECLALGAHDDPTSEGGIVFNQEIANRIKTIEVEKNIRLGDVGCSHITLLNKMDVGEKK